MQIKKNSPFGRTELFLYVVVVEDVILFSQVTNKLYLLPDLRGQQSF